MKKSIYLSLILALVVAMFASCGEDRTHEFYDLTEENQWTYSRMKEVYLWCDKIKEPSRSTFFSKPSKFFSAILYSGDKVSHFVDTVSAGSYGITFAIMRDPIGERPSKVYALVLMVEPGSPADIAGVQRGTWISSVGGLAFTTTKYSMLQSGGSTRLVTEYIDYDDEEERYFWNPGDTVSIGASRVYAERAILLDSVYTVRSKNVGYLVVNNFNGEDFVDKAQDALLRFAASEVSDIIVDLRYCTGGSLTNAVSLASSFVASEHYGNTFANLLDAAGEIDTVYSYTPQLTSFYDKKLYIITGSATAGTAELFTSALNKARPMYDLITFGATTSAVNTVTSPINSPFGFIINPATNYVALANGELLSGITPDYTVNELAQPAYVYPLGSEQEYLLYNVLYYSVQGYLPGKSKSVDVTICRQTDMSFVK